MSKRLTDEEYKQAVRLYPEEVVNEANRARRCEALLLAAIKALLWPNCPSADDVAMLVRMSGTLSSQEYAMPLVESLRAAQARAREVIAAAEGK